MIVYRRRITYLIYNIFDSVKETTNSERRLISTNEVYRNRSQDITNNLFLMGVFCIFYLFTFSCYK